MVEQLPAAFVNLRDVVGPFWTLSSTAKGKV